MDKITILAVAGGSGSGKTTFARALNRGLPPDRSAILAQDHYYIDQSDRFDGDGGSVNFDHPSSIDFELLATHLKELKQGRPIEIPQYDFKTHKRLDKTVTLTPKRLIIVDGILLLSQKNIRDAVCDSVYVDTPEPVRYERRLKRDVEERGRQPEGVRRQYLNQVKPMHDQFVEPSKHLAHHLVTNQEEFDRLLHEYLEAFN